jgi:two-component system, response regulator
MAQKILLVEDNPKDVELTRRALQRANVTNGINVVEDGVEALNFFFGEDGKGGCPDDECPVVILLDLKLPKIDGLEVLRRIRANDKTKRIPVVVLTSSSEEQDIISSYNLGANSYVRKPVRFEDFAEAIRQLGLYWLILNQPAPNGKRKYN